MSVLWPIEPNTRAKHLLYQHYLAAWWPILLQSFPRVTYLDAFAGPGRYQDGEPGSPVFVLEQLLQHGSRERMRLTPDRVRLRFIERDRRRFVHLQRELDREFGPLNQLPVDVQPHCGDAATLTLPLLDQAEAWGHPILAIFDGWGNVNVPLEVMAAIARNPASEVIVTFGPNWFSRRHGLDPDVLDRVFGGRRFWQPADDELRPAERWRVWLETYQAALRRAGFDYTLRFEVVPATGQPLYLVYGTCHPKGLAAMKAAMWGVDGHDGLRFSDPRLRSTPAPDQESLFQDDSGVVYLELVELARQQLALGPLTGAQLGDWLLCETSRWRGLTDALRAARLLRDESAVILEPAHGRITRNTLITLR